MSLTLALFGIIAIVILTAISHDRDHDQQPEPDDGSRDD